jgi:hypothetical protein
MLGRRALVVEVGVLVVAAAVFWFAYWAPRQNGKHDAVDAFSAYAARARLPVRWQQGPGVVESESVGSSYLVCSRRSDASAGAQHLCLTVRTDLPKARQVTGGYRIKTVGYDIPLGDKYACFGYDRGECIQGNG